jgi:hypothetical protein
MPSNLDDLSRHLLKFIESIPIRELVESEKLYSFISEVEDLIEKHRSIDKPRGL